jgi:hypothetical protein
LDNIDHTAGTGFNYTVVSSTPYVTLMNGIYLGTEIYNRIGRKAHMHSIKINAGFFPTTHTAANDSIRIALVYDRQTTTGGAYPSYSDIFTSTDELGNTSAVGPWELTNATNFERFTVLRDWHFNFPVLSSSGTAVNNSSSITDYKHCTLINEYVKLKDLTCHYGSDPFSGGVPVTGGLYLVFCGSVAAASAPYQLAWNARLRFADTQ